MFVDYQLRTIIEVAGALQPKLPEVEFIPCVGLVAAIELLGASGDVDLMILHASSEEDMLGSLRLLETPQWKRRQIPTILLSGIPNLSRRGLSEKIVEVWTKPGNAGDMVYSLRKHLDLKETDKG